MLPPLLLRPEKLPASKAARCRWKETSPMDTLREKRGLIGLSGSRRSTRRPSDRPASRGWSRSRSSSRKTCREFSLVESRDEKQSSRDEHFVVFFFVEFCNRKGPTRARLVPRRLCSWARDSPFCSCDFLLEETTLACIRASGVKVLWYG